MFGVWVFYWYECFSVGCEVVVMVGCIVKVIGRLGRKVCVVQVKVGCIVWIRLGVLCESEVYVR